MNKTTKIVLGVGIVVILAALVWKIWPKAAIPPALTPNTDTPDTFVPPNYPCEENGKCA